MKESIRDRILLYVYEQKGDEREFVELNDFLKGLKRTDLDIGEALRKATVFGRDKPLEIRPFSEAQRLGKKIDPSVTLDNTKFQARLTDAGVAEVKRILAEDDLRQLTKEQIRSFPGTRRMAIIGLVIASLSAIATMGKIIWDIRQGRTEPPTPEVQSTDLKEQSTASMKTSEIQLKDTSSIGNESHHDTVPKKK